MSQELKSFIKYILPTVTIPDIIHRPVFYLKLNCLGLYVSQTKHITSPAPAQQVNSFYSFVTMEC
jgi:hypothetical protein